MALGQQHIPEQFKAVVRLAFKVSHEKAFPVFCSSDAALYNNPESNKPLYPSCNVPELLKAGMAFQPPTAP